MKISFLSLFTAYVFLSLNLSAQTKLFSENDGKGIVISTSGGNQVIWNSKSKIVKSKNWGDNFFYVVWADTGTYSGYSPLGDLNNTGLPNANIFAIRMVKDGSTYKKDTSFGNSGLIRITDRFDQSVEELSVFPYNNGFVIVYSTSSASNAPAGFVQYYNQSGAAQINSSGDGESENTSFKLDYFSPNFPATFFGNYIYYVFTDPALKVMYCDIRDKSCNSTTDLELTANPADGFLVPSYDQTDPGVIIGVQSDWDNNGKFNVKIKRISPNNTWADWVSVTNTDSVFVEYDSGEGNYKGFVRTFYEENGPTYIVWLDTSSTSGLRAGKFLGTSSVDLSTNGGTGYQIADIDVSSMSINDDNVNLYSNNGIFGVTYFDSTGKHLKIFNFSSSSPVEKKDILLSNSDYSRYNYYFSINSSSEVVVFKRDSVTGSGGSLYFSAYDKDINQIFPYSLILSSSSSDNIRYSILNVSDIGNNFALIELEEEGSGPWSYNTYIQIISTQLPPLENLTSLNINRDNDDPLQITFSAVDNNNIINSTYVVQISTLSDFSIIIYSKQVLNSDTSSTTKDLITINGLTHGKTYYFRAKIVDEARQTDFISTYYSYGTEDSHTPEMGIGKWSNIKNSDIPLNPYKELDAKIIDAGNNKSFYIWQHYNYESDEFSIRVAKYSSDGAKEFEKEIITGIKYYEDSDNGFGAVSDGSGGFVIAWSSSNASSTYGFVSRYDSSAQRLWMKDITGSNLPVFGFERELKLLGDKFFALYADSDGDIYVNSFDKSDGSFNNLNLGVNASGLDIISITTTTDNSIIVFYGISGNVNSKKISSSNSITNTGGPYIINNISDDGDQIAVPDNSGGAYFVYADSSDNRLKVFRIDSSLNAVSGYPKEVDMILNTGYGYIYDAGYSPNGPVFAYLNSNTPETSKVKFWSNTDDNVIKTHTYNTGFSRFKVSYNQTHNIVSVAGVTNTNARDNIYVSEYNASDGSEIISPVAGARNLYGFAVDFPRELILEPVSDFFMLGYVSPENSYIQQISTYVSLNIPTSVNATDFQKNSITIGWTENNSNVTEWYVKYSTDGNFDLSITTEVKTTNNPYTALSLMPNTTYYFAVKSSSGVFESEYSLPYNKSTKVETPAGLSVNSRTDSVISFSWNSNGNGTGTLYNIIILDGSNNEIQSSTSTSVSKTFTGLSPNTTYYAKVKAIGNNPGDLSSFTSPVSTKTLIIITDISNISFSQVSADSLKISFDHPSGAKLYQIEASSVSSFGVPAVIITSTTQNNYAVFGTGGEGTLIPNTTYYFRVKAIFDDEQTGYADLGNRSTDPQIPSSLNITSISSISASVSWDANGNPVGTYYNVNVLISSDTSNVYSSTTSNLNINISGLTPNTTYFIKIKSVGNQGQSSYVDSADFKTKVALTGLSNIVYSDISTDSFKVSWNDTVNGDKVYTVTNIDSSKQDFLYSSTTANKYAVFGRGGAGEGDISPNTTYYIAIKVKNVDESDYVFIDTPVVTLANPPADFDFVNVYVSSVSFSWNKNSNPDNTLYRIRYTSDKGNGSYNFTGNTATITDLKGSTTYQFYIAAVNHAGIVTSELNISTLTLTALESVKTIGSGGGNVIFDGGNGEVKLNIPPGSFDSNVVVTVKLPDTNPSSTKSIMGDVSHTNIYVEINTGGNQPKKPVEITMAYSSSTVGFPEDTLVIARYDDTRALWIPLKSYVDKLNRKVRSYTDHFSVFSILSVTPASNISEPKVAPNPLRPSKGAGYTSMTFSNLPANVDIIIYSVSGVKIKKLTTDSSGIALWDGKNESGEDVASGVYFVLVKDGSSSKTIKIGVQR